MLPIVFLLTFGAVSLGAWSLIRPRPNLIAKRLMADGPALTRERQLAGSFSSRSLRPGIRNLGRRLGSLLPENFVRKIDRMLEMADRPWPLQRFLALWAFVA